MGWYQDNFPGSPAQKQRNRVSWIAVGYCIVVGTAAYFFTIRKHRKALEEGNFFYDRWGLDRIKTHIRERSLVHPDHNKEDFMKSIEHKERLAMGDYGAEIPEEQVRAKYN